MKNDTQCFPAGSYYTELSSLVKERNFGQGSGRTNHPTPWGLLHERTCIDILSIFDMLREFIDRHMKSKESCAA